jgi:hypothetical protein
MAGDIIGLTHLTGLSITSTPGSAQTTISYPLLQVQGGSRVVVDSGSSFLVASGTTLTLQTTTISIRTLAGDSSLASIGPTNADCAQLGFVLRASGMSMLVRSGNTIYLFNSAASGAAV